MSKRSLLVSLSLLLLFSLTAPALIFGQSSETILTIAVPDWMGDIYTPELFSDFEAAHPGVKVVLVKSGDSAYFTPAAYDLEEHLNSAEAYARSADVLYVTNYNLSIEAVRAGFFLDLAPLVAGDPNFNESDFFPAIWQSFQWDHSIWAMPQGATVMLLMYDVDAFDAAGLPYPSPSWTLDDLLASARALTQTNADGQITVPGFTPYDTASLFRSLLGDNFYDDSVLPNPPDLVKPELVSLLETWHEWQAELDNSMAEGGYRPDVEIPMVVEQPYRLYSYSVGEEEGRWAAALLPGNRAGLSVTGFAVSAGTFSPELAYELASYLTQKPEAFAFANDFPARQSLVGVTSEDSIYVRPEISPEFQPLIDEALANALPYSDLRYGDYVQLALSKMVDPTKLYDAEAALEEAQADALAALAAAEERRGMAASLQVVTPVPTPVLAPDEIALTFGLMMWSSPLPNQEAWDQVVADFVASDPEVGHLVLNTNQGGMDDPADVNDCFFLPYNRVASSDAVDPKLLNLDPFMSADPNYNTNDVIPGAIAQLQRDNKTWGYPLVISPEVLWYEPGLFEQAGVLSPTDGWSIEVFSEALNMLKMGSESDMPPFVPSYGNTYMLMLIAAYGGLPFDYRTNPPTLNITNPTTVDAIRQALDLAKAGLIDYQELDTTSGGGGGWGPGMIPISSDTLYPGSWRLQYRDQGMGELPPSQIVAYPYGSQYAPVSYQVGAAYISVNAPNPQACYRWISTIAQHAELFLTMPAFQSQIESPSVAAAQGEDIVAFYRQYASLIQAPNAVQFSSSGSSSIGGWIEQIWFNQALDRYVFEDSDLQTDLAEAEIKINSFRECTASIPPYTIDYSNLEEWDAYYKQYTDCAIKIDPALTERFAPVE